MPQEREPDRKAARVAAHAGIEQLLDTLVPSLIAKLATLDVGELEVHEGDWHVRLRRPAGAGPGFGRRATDRTGPKAHAGHDGVGPPSHLVGAPGPGRGAAGSGTISAAAASSNGTTPGLAPVGPGRADEGDAGLDGAPTDVIDSMATSPAVGIFQPGAAAVAGTRVRAGDRLGVVDMLGIPQDVIAPADGIVIVVVVEAGTAVEYGQELVHIESATVTEAR